MTAAHVLNDLMALPPEERREVALRALESVHAPELEEAQHQEILRRERLLAAGEMQLVSWEEVNAELLTDRPNDP